MIVWQEANLLHNYAHNFLAQTVAVIIARVTGYVITQFCGIGVDLIPTFCIVFFLIVCIVIAAKLPRVATDLVD